jgi:hypothetical protein
MSAHSKDSAAVIKFVTLFQKLKDWSDNEPESLPKLVQTDEGVKNLCISRDKTSQVPTKNVSTCTRSPTARGSSHASHLP